jgi:PilZ domain-containing protein
VSESCAVVIATPDVLPTLKERTAAVNGEVLTFSDSEAVRALDAIMTRRPQVLRLERMFASTPRGVALINRIKADPGLSHMEIEVVAHDSDETRVLRQGTGSPRAAVAPEKTAAGPSPSAPPRLAAPPVLAPPTRKPAPLLAPRDASLAPPEPDAAPSAVAPSVQRGTREAARVRMESGLEIAVDGNTATLVDLSSVGAQVISGAALKPNQRVRLALTDDAATVRLSGSVVWASFEISKNGPKYRAGVQFVKPDVQAIEAFCERHKS